jgi:tetratricopeptide (TPR) repeat protein
MRDVVGKAASEALTAMVKDLSEEAEWKARQGDRDGALKLLATVIRDAPDTSFSARALQRALPIALSDIEGKEREAILREFAPWVAELGGVGDRAHARLLVLQQRYRDGAFEDAKKGLGKFLATHAGSDLAPRAQLLLGLATWRSGDREAAMGHLRGLVREHPGHAVAPQAQFLVGYLLFSGEKRDRARGEFARLIRDYPDSAYAEKAIDFVGGELAKRAEATAEGPRWRTLPAVSCRRAAAALRIDGRPDDPAWRGAETVRLTREGPGRRAADSPHVEVKLLWDDTALYVAFACQDADIRSQAKARDDAVLHWDAVRVLIAPAVQATPDGPGRVQDQVKACYDFALSPSGVLRDGKIAFRGDVVLWEHVRHAVAWDAEGVRCAVDVEGTLNDAQADRGWTAEMAIPFGILGPRPTPGIVWRVNVVHVAKSASGDRTVSMWSPSNDWLPQPRGFGRVTFTDRRR